ncbi:hypothetical protein C8034_v004168 [Colletotrichum sidae]|uniref:Uncharacterized protein n=1 Tax=Colletotrichum sidae TaxID=1347389 RepID=A0A4R8T8M2_9PEZI|nr:hypothetical protein C8034_v004168 [Colletotrichum sidae]
MLEPAAPDPFPTPEHPRDALKTPLIARYFHHYITTIAPWYDLSDGALTFTTRLPETALDNPLPFAAIIAVAAVHTSQTTAPSAKPAAEFYHGHCVRLLIELTDGVGDGSSADGFVLASVCLLRSYELLSEEVDPNRHLRGAYSLAAYRNPVTDHQASGFRAAGFWNYLREDITFSLFQRCPLKMDLEQVPPPTRHDTDQGYLNTVSLILGRVINACFAGPVTTEEWRLLLGMLRDWMSHLPARFLPYSREDRGLSLALPSVWMLQDCHAAALHYQLVSLTLLCLHSPSDCASEMRAFIDGSMEQNATKENVLENLALEICGAAFTSNNPSVIINAFGPMAFCT